MSTPLSDEELADLVIHADTRNQTLGIVGVLFVTRNRFLQVLEGERAAVRWLYSQIAQDSRHRGMTKLMDAPIERSAFAGWSMRLLCESDLSDDLRVPVLEAIESARFLDGDEKPRSFDLTGLQACPAALASAVFARDVRSNRLQAGVSNDA